MAHCRVCSTELNDGNWVASLMKKNSKICKKCHLDKGRDWRLKNKEKVKSYSSAAYSKNPKIHHERVRISRQKVRIKTLDQYGGKCAHCGISDYDVLDIDHINNDGARERKMNLFAYNLYRKLKKDGYPKDRYQILCKNCNWKKEIYRRKE